MNVDVKELWTKRYKLYIKEMSRYLKLIFNDHIKLVLVFAVGAGAFYYQKWLETLSNEFPTAFIMALLLSLVLTQGSIRTYLKEADLVFLLPVETKLRPYFKMSKITSFLIQSYLLIVVIAALLPLYFHQYSKGFTYVIAIVILLLIVKAWNIELKWLIHYFQDKRIHYSDFIVRITLNFVFIYFLVSHAPLIYPLIIGMIMVGLLFYFRGITKNKSLKWRLLIDDENKSAMAFYRIANLFTDVPKAMEQVKRRSWLNFLMRRIPYNQSSTFEYLYMKTFIRTGDYVGIYLRLFIIGALLLYFLPFEYGKLIVFLLFSYLVGFQLMTLYRHHVTKIWIDLYPVSMENKRASFLKILFQLMLYLTFLYSVVLFIWSAWILGLTAIIIGVLFNYAFVYFYVRSRLLKMDQI